MTISAVNANGKSESATLEGFTLKVAELQLGEYIDKKINHLEIIL